MYKLHRTVILIRNVLLAAPADSAGNHLTLERGTALPADDFAAESEPALILFIIVPDAALSEPLFQHFMCCRVQFPADDRLVVVFHFRTVHVALVPVPAEVVVRIGFVVANVTDIFLIIQNAHDRCGTPLAAPARLHTTAVQFLAYFMHTHAGNNGLENEADNVCFLRYDRIVSVTVKRVSVGRCSCSVPAVFDAFLVTPLHILGNGLGFLLRKTAEDSQNKLCFHAACIQLFLLEVNGYVIRKQFTHQFKAVRGIA